MAREDLISGLVDGEVFKRLSESPAFVEALKKIHDTFDKGVTSVETTAKNVEQSAERIAGEVETRFTELEERIKELEAQLVAKVKKAPKTPTPTDSENGQ